ncbi:MAG: aldehyde dehydrogenase [Rhodoglobus sp.]|nr:aldehyde dehydrogenase [Rhodoglobus sp.]
MRTSNEMAEAAFLAGSFATEPLVRRAAVLLAIADAVDARVDELVACAMTETGLEDARLRGEVRRTTVQLRLFADVVAEGGFLDVRIDERDEAFVLGVRPDLRRMRTPIGPVLNFAASNFPFAFSVVGGDTAAALAAGCSVIVKAHPGHPELSRLTAQIAIDAIARSGAPRDLLQLAEGREMSVELLRHPRIAAASFTGSLGGGRVLADIAAARPDPIPFYGELGSVNPVVVTQAAIAERRGQVVDGFVASISGSAGQLCTKPGFLFVPAGSDIAADVAAAFAALPEHRLLFPRLAEGFAARRQEILDVPDLEVAASGSIRFDEDGNGWARPALAVATLEELRAAGSVLMDECFGPLAIIVPYDDADVLAEDFVGLFEGNLTAGLHLAAGESAGWIERLVSVMSHHAGRVLFNGWPTGVAVTHAQQHGGPWPATTTGTTSVGTASIERFLRAVAYQDAPEEFLPAPLRDDNPWGVPQARSRAGESAHWGERAAAGS